MPFSLLVAIFLAFGFQIGVDEGPASAGELRARILETTGGVLAVGLAAFLLGQSIAMRVARAGGPSGRIRHAFLVGSRAIEVFTLLIYAWIIHDVGWPAVVERGFGLQNAILIDEFLILLPFLLAQLLAWWGVYSGERALRTQRPKVTRSHYMVLRARQALGLVLPVALVFSLGQDLLRRQWPESSQQAWVELAWMAVMGTFVLILSPAFVRLTWPTRPLPAGDLRDRLERLARRFGFRCTDILVWDTGQAIVNAGVTGALPWFRYVFLTDALVDHFEPHKIEAVFGHEVGHIVHRHLVYFGFFFLGSVAVMALVNDQLAVLLGALFQRVGWSVLDPSGTSAGTAAIQLLVAVLILAAYFILVFGYLSRRFERQADVFGCRAVSCGRHDCPPHADLNAMDPLVAPPRELCIFGIQTFADALSKVADYNGMERESFWAWRHGSIGRRIRFLRTLEGRPEAERVFQSGVRWLRVGLAVVLCSALLWAMWAGAFERLQ